MPKKMKYETIVEFVAMKQVIAERPAPYKEGITSTQAAGRLAIELIGSDAAESVLLICLNTKNEINAVHKVFSGSLNSSVAHPREIFRTAIMVNAARIIIAHNHPSGGLNPSDADITFTRRLETAGETIGITLLDHLIVSDHEYNSLREYGIL